jgi:peroxiredoxin
LLVIVLGAAIWWLELRGGAAKGSISREEGVGVVALPDGENPTGREAAAERGRAAPNFQLRQPDGKLISLVDYRGSWVLVNFWASWCGPCRSEAANLEQLSRGSKGELAVIGVNLQETAADVQGFAAEFGLSYPLVMDRTAEVSEAYRIETGLPVSFLVTPQGVIERVFIGRVTEAQIREAAQLREGAG